MSKVKNVSGGPLEVPFLDMRVIQPDEIVDVPDVQGDGVSPIIWPPGTWEPVTEDKPSRAGKAAG